MLSGNNRYAKLDHPMNDCGKHGNVSANMGSQGDMFNPHSF